MSDYVVRVQKEKADAINLLKEEFKDAKDYIFTDYRGLTVAQITELRNDLREQKAVLKVVKNRYAKIALKDMEYPLVDDLLTGPTAIALAKDESGPVAKLIVAFAKNNPIVLKGGIVDGGVFDSNQMVAFSKLPSKKELISKLMATMKAPVQNIVYILNAVPQKLVRTLLAVKEQKEAK